MADELDARPDNVPVKGYAGDTLTIVITAPDALVAGRQWAAEVRADRTSETAPDATFTITPPSVVDGPAYLVLTSAQTAALLALGTARRTARAGGVYAMAQSYNGEWDCQLSAAGTDPVTTLVQGSLTIDVDVTRPVQP